MGRDASASHVRAREGGVNRRRHNCPSLQEEHVFGGLETKQQKWYNCFGELCVSRDAQS